MLERLTQEGRTQANYWAEHDSREIEVEHADWEQVVTHILVHRYKFTYTFTYTIIHINTHS